MPEPSFFHSPPPSWQLHAIRTACCGGLALHACFYARGGPVEGGAVKGGQWTEGEGTNWTLEKGWRDEGHDCFECVSVAVNLNWGVRTRDDAHALLLTTKVVARSKASLLQLCLISLQYFSEMTRVGESISHSIFLTRKSLRSALSPIATAPF